MIINAEELKEAARKALAAGETIGFFIEAHLRRSGAMEIEGLLGLTAGRLLFVHRPVFAQPQVVLFDRRSFEIVSKEEDLWGAKLKARVGDEAIEFTRIAPPDFKQLWAELSGEEVEIVGELVPEEQLSPSATIQTSEPIMMPEPIVIEQIPERPQKPKIQFIPPTPTCYLHPDVESKSRCEECGKPICPICTVPFNFKGYCPRCIDKAKQKFKAKKILEAQKKPPAIPARPAASPTRLDGTPVKTGGVPLSRSPALAFLLSFIPGFGQFYNGDGIRGMITILSFLLIYYTPPARALLNPENINLEFIRTLPLQFFVPFFVWFISFFDSIYRAQKRNAEQGVKAQPAGCSVLLLLIIATSIIGALTWLIYNPSAVQYISGQPPAAVETIPESDLQMRHLKVKEMLKEFYALQNAYYVAHNEYMAYVPYDISRKNDTGYRLAITNPGAGIYDYRFYAWALVGKEKVLDLWYVTKDGNIVHDYGSDLK